MVEATTMGADVATVITAWLLFAVFAHALHHKLFEWPRFVAALAAYRLVPRALVMPSALLVTAGELAAAPLLLFVEASGLVLGTSLLLVYAFAMGINLARGRRYIDCGCGDEPVPLSVLMVGRNLALAGAGGAALAGAGTLELADLGWQQLLLAFAGASVATGVYVCMNQLLANRGRYQRLWHGLSHEG